MRNLYAIVAHIGTDNVSTHYIVSTHKTYIEAQQELNKLSESDPKTRYVIFNMDQLY